MIFNVALFFYLLAILPKLLFDLLKGKKHPSLLQRLGASLPNPQGKPVIWIHGVSVGEIKAAQPLFRALKQKHPSAFFLITTTTATGQSEARRSLSEADAFCYLPLDFTFVVRRWVQKLRPQLFLLIESDFWPNLLAAIQRAGGKTILVSGKMSERSFKRFLLFSPLARCLFDRFDLLLVQNQTHHGRFFPFANPSRLHITGNLKLDFQPQIPDTSYWKGKISLPVITIASTHAPEEEQILDALKNLDLFLFLAPRHPERFEAVAELLTQKKIPFIRFSQPHLQGERVVLVDAMGRLPLCYSLSRLAIVGGSFIPQIGGHNILEPCLYGAPVLFGPHMHAQEELTARVLEAKAGRQVPLNQLSSSIRDLLHDSAMQHAAKKIIETCKGATEKVLPHINDLFR